MQVQQHIYLQDYRRHSVAVSMEIVLYVHAVSQRKNDHMQVYIVIMEDMKWFNCG